MAVGEGEGLTCDAAQPTGRRMRLCTPGSSMTPREGERGHKGIAGCPWGGV